MNQTNCAESEEAVSKAALLSFVVKAVVCETANKAIHNLEANIRKTSAILIFILSHHNTIFDGVWRAIYLVNLNS